MGSVGNFLFGGSQQKQKSTNTSSSSSSNQSSNSNVQASQSSSNQNSASGSANRSYDALASALTPSLGYVSSAGNMLGALLGLPQSTFNYTPPAPSVLPVQASGGSGGGGGANRNIINMLLNRYLTNKPAAPAPAANPYPVPIPTGGSYVPVSYGPSDAGELGGKGERLPLPINSGEHVQYRAAGGPVQAGQPYVVGEKRPELFVPHTDGTIIPSVPQTATATTAPAPFGLRDLARHQPRGVRGGPIAVPPVTTPPVTTPPAATPPPPQPVYNPAAPNPSDAVNTFANSAGMNFILDQGQKALSGASAANGVFNSGATGKALTQYGQQLGSQYLRDYMDKLLDYAKLGLGSAGALSGAGGISQSVGSGGSNSTSFGYGSGQSSGTATSSGTGTSSGSGNSKNGLVPALTRAAASAAAAGA